MSNKFVLGVVAAFVFSGLAAADDKPAKVGEVVKLEGKLACTKCELQETKACGHALIVKEKKDGKETEVKYYLNDNGAKEKFHSKVCTAPKDAKVEGKLGEEKAKDGKKRLVLNDSKVEVK